MSDNSDIINAIRGIANPDFRKTCMIVQGTVTHVNADTTINVKPIVGLGIADLENVETSSSPDGMVPIPTVGSQVNVLMSSYVQPFVVQYGDIEKYNLIGDEFEGLVKVIELTDKLNKLEQTVNALSTLTQSLLNEYNSHTHTSAAPSSPTSPPIVPSTLTPPSQIVATTKDEIQNPDVMHGAGVA